MSTMSSFNVEVRSFSRANWWVYLIYLVLLLIIHFVATDKDLASVFMVTSVHFIADIFIMMMLSAYARGDYGTGTYHQIVSMLLFLSIKIYTGVSGGGWHYILADPIYILAAVKHYQIDIKHRDIRFINTTNMSVLSVFLVIIVTLSFKMADEHILESIARWVQTCGIFLFAIALSTVGNERLRYQLSVIALLCMVVGSGWELVRELQSGQVFGLAVSYFLLPLTVLVFYIKSWTAGAKASV